MELSEAKRVLNDWNKAEEWTIKDPDYRHKDVYIERKEAIETVLQALDELQKENEGLRKLSDHYQNLINYKYIQKENIEKKIDEQTERIDKLLDEMIDKSIGGINVSGLNKKEREQVIAKRNGLLVQKATLQQVKDELLKGE